jgi:hypothetical protein
MKFVGSLILGALLTCASALATSFPQCPAVGNDTSGCEFLITVTAASGGAATAFTVTASSPDQGPYDGADDTLVGVLNMSGATLTSLALSSPLNIFGFEGDGVCAFISCPGATDPSGYAPAGVTFSGINATATAGTVNFSGLKDGSSTFFSLEDALSASQIQPGVPEPATLSLLGAGLAAVYFVGRKRKR